MRGVLHVFEAMIAVTMMLMLTAAIYPPLTETERIDQYRRVGFEALKYLDNSGHLRNLAVLNNTTAMEQELSTIFPSNVYYSIEICDFSAHCTFTPIMNDSMVLNTYFISGNSSYEPREVKLYIWMK